MASRCARRPSTPNPLADSADAADGSDLDHTSRSVCHDVHAGQGPTTGKYWGTVVDLNLSMVTRPVERLLATAQNGLEVLRLGGLETGSMPSPSQTVQSVPMY